MDRFAALRAYTGVVEAGSFVGAAQRLGVSTSALSRQIGELEHHLGVRLLQRTTRRLSLTETGQAFYERAVALLADLAEAESLAGEAAVAPRGTIKLTTSYSLAQQKIAPALTSFVQRYANVRFDLTVSDRIVDLVEEGFDLAVRVGTVGSERLVARRLGATVAIVCASPAYLQRHGVPKTPEDLATHSALTYAYSPTPNVWRFTDPQGEQRSVRVAGSLHSNSGDTAVAAAIAGLGIVCEPDFLVVDALEAGALVPVLADYRAFKSDIWAVYPSRRHLSLRVRLFVDHLIAAFGAVVAAHQ